MDAIIEKHPDTYTLEMETYSIYALANMARNNDVYAANASVVVCNKANPDKHLAGPKQTEVEDLVGYSMFKGLADFDFPGGEPKFTTEMIKRVRDEELKKTGINKKLPYDRIRAVSYTHLTLPTICSV